MMVNNSFEKNSLKTITITSFFLFLAIVGLFYFNDYGLHWDSMAQYEIGRVNLDYIFKGDSKLLDFQNRYYGPIFEIFLLLPTGHLPIREMFFTQHLLNYLFFLFGLFCFFKLIESITKDWRLGLAGCMMLVLSPRIFAESFYNTKDIPFMTMFIISFFTMNRLFLKTSIINTILHAFSSAILIAIRLQGILIIPITAVMFAYLLFFRNHQTNRFSFIALGFVYVISTASFVYLFFPAIWHDPINEFISGLQMFSNFPWLGGVVLYRGEMIEATKLPWHYIPVWMIITIPIIVSVFFAIGSFYFLKNFFKRFRDTLHNDLFFLLSFLWLSLPIITILLLGSVLYDGWRHLYFIYPGLILIAIYGLMNLSRIKISKFGSIISNQITVFVLLILGLIEPAIFMIKNHPFEYVYFNDFAGSDYKTIKQEFEMDYWGLSYLDAYENLLDLDNRNKIKIKIDNDPGDFNLFMLDAAEKERFIVVDHVKEADYFLTNFRWHPQDYEFKVFSSIIVEGVNINSIYDVNKES